MILFASDWSKYKSAIIDLKTKNKSFIHLAQLYKDEMGIRNHAFLLALINPELQGVDPFSPELTQEQMTMIAIECEINPWYFFREIAMAPPDGGLEADQFEANRANIAAFWCFFNHILFILIQPRQTGKSYSMDVLKVELMLFLCKNTLINLLTKDETLRTENVERIKKIMDCLPRYLDFRRRDDSNNTEAVTVKEFNNRFRTHLPQSSEQGAYRAGRGLTTPIFFIDEPPFCKNIHITLGSALGSTGASVDRAIKQGSQYGTVLTTTAGNKDEVEGAYIYNIIQESADWNEKFFDAKDAKDLEKIIRSCSKNGKFRIHMNFNHRQLGKTDAWLRMKIDAALSNGQDAERDFLNKWTSGNSSNPLNSLPDGRILLEAIAESKKDVVHLEITEPYGFIIRWYMPEATIQRRMASSKFILAEDPSEAGGHDDIGMVMIDVETLEVVAAGHYNETNLLTYSKWLAEFLIKYENVTAIIERRSTGSSILDNLLIWLPDAGIDPFKRLYNTIVNNGYSDEEKFNEIKTPLGKRDPHIYERYKTAFGFATSGGGVTSRTSLYSTTLFNAVKLAKDKVYDKKLIAQISELIVKNGRVNHPSGGHDDLVIAWLLAHWLIAQGQNLSYYGITGIMRHILPAKQQTTTDLLERREQGRIRGRITEISKMLNETNDEYVSMKLENELRILDKKIILQDGEFYSLDSLLSKIKENKKNKYRTASYRHQGHSYNGEIINRQVTSGGTITDHPVSMNELLYRR